jgi:hypothetical protein
MDGESGGECCAPDGTRPMGGVLDRLRPLKRLRRRVVEGAVARGADREEAEAAVGELGDGTLLEWLMNGGLEKLIELVLKLIAVI